MGRFMLIAVIDLMKPAQDKAHDGGAIDERKPQRIRNAQHPLAHRLLRKKLIHQQRGTF